jgi:hypothetical protein
LVLCVLGACGDGTKPVTPIDAHVVFDLLDGVPALTVSPSVFDFGSVAIGCPSATGAFTLTNPGARSTPPMLTGVSGTDANDFAIANDTCNGQSLAPNSGCTLDVTFQPTAPGAKTATLAISATVALQASVPLDGAGLAASALGLSPVLLAFGTVPPGTTSTKSFTLTNNGCATTGTLTLTLAGSDPTFFSLGSDGCSNAVLAPSESCTTAVVFGPLSAASRTAAIAISAQPGGSVSVSMTGD